MAPLPNGCKLNETDRENVKKSASRGVHTKVAPVRRDSKPPHLGAHLDVDLVLSPLPTDGVVPAESHKVELQ